MALIGRAHGGAPDARWDFSTNANAAGPCPAALAAVQTADATRYPDAACLRVREALAALHGVEPWRVLPAASASEFIQRMTAVSGRLWPGAVRVPLHAYGDYRAAASAWGRAVCAAGSAEEAVATLRWYAEPSSPLGQAEPPPANPEAVPTVLDAVYAPSRLAGTPTWTAQALDRVFVLHSPNKALGLTGVRGAYAVAPRSAGYDIEPLCRALQAAEPSWPWSAHAEAMLACWSTAPVQQWVADSRATLAAWKRELQKCLTARGFRLLASLTRFFVARPAQPLEPRALRARGIAVRETTSFGLPGCWRLAAQPPAAVDALASALDAVSGS